MPRSLRPSRRASRVGRLVRRYWTDGGLPPSVSDLYRDVVRLSIVDVVTRSVANVLPVRTGWRISRCSVPAPIVRWRWRRYATRGPLDGSFHELGHHHASVVADALQAVGLEPFLVDRSGDGFVIGVRLEHRARAWQGLRGLLPDDRWLVRWHRGRRSGVQAVVDGRMPRQVRRAVRWDLFVASAWGDELAGPEAACTVTFWQLAPSGQRELVGVRGQERFDDRSERTTVEVDGHAYPGLTAFPIGRQLEHMEEPLDVVVTWVDGADPDWQRDFKRWASAAGRSVAETALDPGRYRSRDELRYLLRSLWFLCGWVRRVYIVTSGQVPEWLVQDGRLRVVPHAEILPADALPTFNSHAIESSLHHIDGLAEHFIYFNDDMFIGRPLRPEHFFTPNGLARVFQSDARVPCVENEDTLAVDTAAIRGRELLMERVGRAVAHKPLHAPYPLRRSVLYELEEQFEVEVDRTAHSRFRHPNDLSIAASFAQHYAFTTGRAVLGDARVEYVHLESARLALHLQRLRLGRAVDSFCLNETEQTASNAEAVDRTVTEFLDGYFPLPSPWERS